MDQILDGLNAAQHAAVICPASVLQILAPPGSGKTKTLTARIAFLLTQCGYKPWNILCLTFTIKSAREMKERVSRLIGNGLEAKLILGTFHSVCRRYLVSYGHLVGLRKGFGIADTSDTSSIIRRIIKRHRLNIDPKKAQSRISNSKSKGIRSYDLKQQQHKLRNIDQIEFHTVYEAYEQQLCNSNMLDYDDLLLKCVDLLRQHPECVSNVEVVMIDEFQDTNVVQFELMELFATRQNRVTTVGDPDQSIYGWRSAEVKNLSRMKAKYPDALTIHLEDNYRSSGAILLAASEIIEQDNTRLPRPILPTHCPGSIPVLRRLPTTEIEAKWIVSEIVRIRGATGHLLSYADFAILLRSASLSRQIESAMGHAGIPYRMVGGQKFFDRVEIKILLDYLRAISQPDNNDALARIINIPSRGIGLTTIQALLAEAEAKGVSLWVLIQDAVQGQIKPRSRISKQAERSMGLFVNIILSLRTKLFKTACQSSPQSLLTLIIKKIGFRQYLEKNYETDHEARWSNVEELLVQASEYSVSSNDQSVDQLNGEDSLPQIEGLEQNLGSLAEELLSKFLANVALATELQRDETQVDGDNVPQAQVTISTIHASKGLEWPVVYIPSAYEGCIPHSRAEDTDEERRLLYVAMTRAQALLYISYPIRNSQKDETTISCFLSSKKVCHYLADKEPILDFNAVADISRILRRQCPSEKEIIEGNRSIRTHDDKLWPLSDEENAETIDIRGESTERIVVRHKRRRLRDEDIDTQLLMRSELENLKSTKLIALIGTETTMDAKSKFSYQGQNGFTTATAQLSQLVKATGDSERAGCMRQGSNEFLNAEDEFRQGDRKNSRLSKSSEGQYSLLRYLTASNRPDSISLDRNVLQAPTNFVVSTSQVEDVISSKSTSSKATSNTATACGESRYSESKQPLTVIPQGLADHRLMPITKTNRPCRDLPEEQHNSKPYVFLSSSPPPPPMQATCEEKGSMGDENSRQNKIGPGISNVTSAAQDNDTRPAITFHVTSVTQVRSSTTKRTLGVRRSVNAGWASRGNRPFSVPRKP